MAKQHGTRIAQIWIKYPYELEEKIKKGFWREFSTASCSWLPGIQGPLAGCCHPHQLLSYRLQKRQADLSQHSPDSSGRSHDCCHFLRGWGSLWENMGWPCLPCQGREYPPPPFRNFLWPRTCLSSWLLVWPSIIWMQEGKYLDIFTVKQSNWPYAKNKTAQTEFVHNWLINLRIFLCYVYHFSYKHLPYNQSFVLYSVPAELLGNYKKWWHFTRWVINT